MKSWTMQIGSAAVVALCLGACGGTSSGTPDGGSSIADASPPDGGTVETGMVYGALKSDGPVAGAKVCVLNHPEVHCATTDATGSYSMNVPFLPANADIAITTTAAGYLGSVNLEHEVLPAVVWPSGVPLYSDAEAKNLLATEAGFTYPASGSGFVEVRVHGVNAGQLTGATATISPASGTGPVYRNASGVPDPALKATTSSGGVLFGNVNPGNVTITVTAAGKTCTAAPGGAVTAGDWPPSGSGTVAGVVVAGSFTASLDVLCQ